MCTMASQITSLTIVYSTVYSCADQRKYLSSASPAFVRRIHRNPKIKLFAIMSSHGNDTVYPKKYAHGFCFAVLCCGYTLTDLPISIRLTSLALWQSNDCPSASKATLMNMDKYFMWIHYERLHDQNKAKHNKTVCIFLGIYCIINISYAHWEFSSMIHPREISHYKTLHYYDVLMGAIAYQITSLTMVYSTVYSDADQRKHQSSASLAFERGIHRDRWIPRTNGQ